MQAIQVRAESAGDAGCGVAEAGKHPMPPCGYSQLPQVEGAKGGWSHHSWLRSNFISVRTGTTCAFHSPASTSREARRSYRVVLPGSQVCASGGGNSAVFSSTSSRG